MLIVAPVESGAVWRRRTVSCKSVSKGEGERMVVRAESVLPAHINMKYEGRVRSDGEVDDGAMLRIGVRGNARDVMAVKDVKGSVVNVAGQMPRARVDVVTAVVVAPIRMASVEVANQEKRKTTIVTIRSNSGDRGSDLSHAVVTVLVVLWRDIDDAEKKSGVTRTWWANSAPED